MTDSLVELSYHTKFTKGINIMNQLNSTTFTPDRQRGQHLKFEDRCSICIFNKLGYSLRKTAETIGCYASTVLNELRNGVGKRNGIRGRNPKYSHKDPRQGFCLSKNCNGSTQGRIWGR